jgi:hypothetical protein
LLRPTKKRLLDRQHDVRFLFQMAPDSHQGAGCRFNSCNKRICGGEYRIAVAPGSSDHWARAPGMSLTGNSQPQ